MNNARIRDATVVCRYQTARRGATSAAAAHVIAARTMADAGIAHSRLAANTAQRNRRRDPQACGQQMPARQPTFGSPPRDRDHAAERAGPEHGGVPEQHAKQHRETGATPWMQREVAKVHIGRLEHQAEHSLEACQHQARARVPMPAATR